MNSSKRTQILIGLLLVVSMSALSGCRLGRRETPTPIAITLPGQLPGNGVANSSETYIVQKGEVVQEEVLTGRVIPAREENLFFRRGGQITDVYVEDGARVQAGDIIAILDNEILEIDLESALIGLTIAKEDLSDAQQDLAYRRRQAELALDIAQINLNSLTITASVEPSQLEEPTSVQVRRIQAELAQLTLDNIDETLDPTTEWVVNRNELAVARVKQAILEGQIEAPFEGELRFINLPEADEQLAVQAYAVVARLVDTSKFKIELNLPRAQLESFTEGMSVAISAPSLGDRTLPAVIEALPRPFGTSPGSLTEVTLTNAEDNSQLREGITVVVNVRLKSKPAALVIPRAALQEENQIYYVTVQEGTEVRRVTVAVGVLGSDLVEIVAGLKEGQTIVLGQ